MISRTKATRNRAHLFVVLALVTAGATNAQTENIEGEKCTVSESAQSRLREVAAYALQNKASHPVPDTWARILGLDTAAAKFVRKQAVIRDPDGVHVHVFAADANNSGKFLIMRRGRGPLEVFLTDSAFSLIAAVVDDKPTRMKLSVADVAVCSRYRTEVDLWKEAVFENLTSK